MSDEEVIFTPVFKGDRYLYHECSECEYQVKMRAECLTSLYFGERFKFCPNCGKPVIRFANLPKFVEEFNYAIFNEIDTLYKQFKDNLDYYCRVTLTKEEFEEMISKCQFAVELQENGGAYVSPAVSMVAKMNSKKWNHWEIEKLIERVERNDGGRNNQRKEDEGK